MYINCVFYVRKDTRITTHNFEYAGTLVKTKRSAACSQTPAEPQFSCSYMKHDGDKRSEYVLFYDKKKSQLPRI